MYNIRMGILASKSMKRAFLLATVSLAAVPSLSFATDWKVDPQVQRQFQDHLAIGKKILKDTDCPEIRSFSSQAAQVQENLRDVEQTPSGKDVISIATSTHLKLCAPEEKIEGILPENSTLRAGGLYNWIGFIRIEKLKDPKATDGVKNLVAPVNMAHELFHHHQNKGGFSYQRNVFLKKNEFIKLDLYNEAAAFAFQTRFFFEYVKNRPGEYRFDEFSAKLFFAFKEDYEANAGKFKSEKERLNAATVVAFRAFFDMPELQSLRDLYLTRPRSGRTPSEQEMFDNSVKKGNDGLMTLADIKHVTTLPNGFTLYKPNRVPTDAEFNAGQYIPVAKPAAPAFKGS